MGSGSGGSAWLRSWGKDDFLIGSVDVSPCKARKLSGDLLGILNSQNDGVS